VESSLDSIIERLEFKSNQKVADIFNCSRANIAKRRQLNSPISKEETYILYDHVLKMGWYNKISVLQPLVDEAFPRLRTPGQMLAEFTVDPWRHLILFLPSLENAKVVYDLLGKDMRFTEEKRELKIYIPGSARLLDEVVGLFTDRDRLRLRYELTVFCADNLPFNSGLLIADGRLPLQPSSTGFLPLGDIASERSYNDATTLMQQVRTPQYGPVFVQSVGAPPERLPGASDGSSIVIHYTGQLGGDYRLTVNCDDLPDENQQWRMRLTSRGVEPVEPRSIELFDQAGRTIIKTRSDNLPWQGFWPDYNHPLLIHIDELLITEFVSPVNFG